MKTLYAACLSRLGLSQAEAAELHGVSIDTIKKWSSGRSQLPDGIWAELRAREARIIADAARRASSDPIVMAVIALAP